MTNTKRTYSCEFFPPRTDKGRESWREAFTELRKLNMDYYSCTYGAGGTTQEGTWDTVQEIMAAGQQAAAHITCIGSTPEKISELLERYKGAGVNRLVALRGDLPEGQDTAGHFLYANQLISFIRETTGDYFHIEIAAYLEKHPEAKSLQEDMQHFKLKADAGANSALTQYFFNPDAYFRFVDDITAMGVDIPIVPGIMPITNLERLARFSDACGAEIPRWIRTRLEGYSDEESIIQFGLEVVSEQCQKLLDQGAPGLHFYPLNRAEPTVSLWKGLRF